MPVRIIPAQLTAPSEKSAAYEETRKIKVAAYARVSTELEEQESSFESQVQHYTDYITGTPAWELAGVYADDGISGTGTRKREQFNAMIADCRAGQIDMVITKSISRFARNTVDCLKYIRELKELGIPVLFEKERINTMDSTGEMLITIMASLAQQESQSISQNVRMGHHYRMQQGKPMVNTNFMGYRMSPDKSCLVIVPEQAVIVRRIFREFLDGRSPAQIAASLMADGIPSPSGRDRWYTSCIVSMLQNEKFMGDLLLQKWYIRDFISKKAVPNCGTFPQYYVENAHPPIVPRAIFMQVKGEFLRRRYLREMTGRKTLHRGGSPFYEKIVCGKCGNTYRRFARQPGNGHTSWRCRNRIQKDASCAGRIVRETDVQDAVVWAFGMLPEHRTELEDFLTARTPEEADLQEKIASLTERERALHDRISRYAETGVIDAESPDVHSAVNSEPPTPEELEFRQMKTELADLSLQKKELLRQKSAYDSRKVYARNLLTLIEGIAGKETGGAEKTGESTDSVVRSAACTDPDDFFRRTTRARRHGPITQFSGDDCDEFVEKIAVHKEQMTVVFKGGVLIIVNL